MAMYEGNFDGVPSATVRRLPHIFIVDVPTRFVHQVHLALRGFLTAINSSYIVECQRLDYCLFSILLPQGFYDKSSRDQ